MKVIPIIGIHSSGKSTVASFLKEKGYLCLPEIASLLMNQGYPAGLYATDEFEFKVMEEEFKRDELYFNSGKTILPETWHIGNIAHVMVKSQKITKLYLQRFKKCRDRYNIHAIFLDIPIEEVLKRTKYYPKSENSKKIISFNRKVYNNLHYLLEEFSIPFSLIDSSQPIEKTKTDVLSLLRRLY